MFDFTSSDGIGFFNRRIKDTQLIQISWILPTASIIIATLIHYFSGNYRDIPFFISETDHPGLEDHVFSIGLFLSALIQSIVSFRLYILFKPIASPRLHLFALLCGLATSTHLAVLAFATMDQFLEIHIYTAMVVFHGGFAWAFATHFSLPKSKSKGRKVRVYSLLLAFTSLVVMTVSIRDGIKSGEKELGVHSSEIGLEYLQPWVDYAAPAEYLLFFGLIGCLASFRWDIREHATEGQDTPIES
jgi:hypothetical protein